MVYERYLSDTPSRTKLIDAFLVFLVVVGVLQFVYCVVAGNYVSFPEPRAARRRTRCWMELGVERKVAGKGRGCDRMRLMVQ